MARSVYELFRDTASARPTAPAAREKVGGAWGDASWGDLATAVDHAAAALLRFGVEPGDRVSIVSNTRVEWSIADLAIMGAAAVTVPICHSNTAAEREYVLCDAGVVVASSRTRSSSRTTSGR